MIKTTEKRIAALERLISPPRRHRVLVLDATVVGPDVAYADYCAATPGKRAKNIILLIDAASQPEQP